VIRWLEDLPTVWLIVVVFVGTALVTAAIYLGQTSSRIDALIDRHIHDAADHRSARATG
jgi:hypothetical protein